MWQAITGSGKTLAFAIPTVEMYVEAHQRDSSHRGERGLFAVVILPTRELAAQVHAVVERLCLEMERARKREEESGALVDEYSSPRCVLCTGGGGDASVRKGGEIFFSPLVFPFFFVVMSL